MKLNRNNYEEYFILYLDNELGDEERLQVESFAEENPDLKAELELLLQSKLVPDDDISFAGKESLLVHTVPPLTLTNYEEWLLSYIDNELTAAERTAVEEFIAANPVIQQELNVLQKTKLQPEAVVFPGKESLYRHEEKVKVVSIKWRRLAVAAALLTAISTTAIVLLNKKSGTTDPGSIAGKINTEKTSGEKKTVDPAATRQEIIAGVNPDEKEVIQKENNNPVLHKDKDNDRILAASVKEKETKQTKNQPEEEKPLIASVEEPAVRNRNGLPSPTPANPYTSETIKSGEDFATVSPSNSASLTDHIENSSSLKVTTPTAATYNKGNKPGNTDDLHFASENVQKGGVRGFLRKVTRTIEKRTNIKMTDDDDRLLIAGLAIKLD